MLLIRSSPLRRVYIKIPRFFFFAHLHLHLKLSRIIYRDSKREALSELLCIKFQEPQMKVFRRPKVSGFFGEAINEV